jgi:hypothetical protein
MEKSLLNRLAPELRADIFERVFTYDRLFRHAKRWLVYRNGERNCRPISKDLGPTLACKQMRSEILHLPLLLNDLVFGCEAGDFDPYMSWWTLPPLKDPCERAIDALQKMTPAVLPDSTTLQLNLWVFPLMAEPREMSSTDWVQFGNVFKKLVDVLGPVKLVVNLHFHTNYEHLRCVVPDHAVLAIRGKTVLDVSSGGPDAIARAIAGVAKEIDDQRQALQQHADHYWEDCRIMSNRKKISEFLTQAETVARGVLEVVASASSSKALQSPVCTLPGTGGGSQILHLNRKSDATVEEAQ